MAGSSSKKSAPVLYIQDDIRRAVPKAIFPIIFFGALPPTASWYDIKDPNLVRMDRDLITSVFFPEGIDGRRNWNRCLVSFDQDYTVGFSTNHNALQRVLPNISHPNPVYHFSSGTSSPTNVRSGWMFRYDAMFIRNHAVASTTKNVPQSSSEETTSTKFVMNFPKSVRRSSSVPSS